MKIERRSIEFIPEEERHGSVRNLFSIWFSSNMQITVVVTGGLAIVFGLNLFWSVIAIVLGNLIGGIFMASHSAQGPKLGIPQMIQSRAQFGIIGAVIPLIIVILMYVGFFASSGLLGAQAISSFSPISVTWSVVLLSILTLIVTVFGYDLIHALEKYFSYLFAIVFFAATILIFRLKLPAHSWSPGHVDFGVFFLVLSIVATWQITYAPYVADYSRYLPSNTPPVQTFWYSYLGSVIGTAWMMILGVILTVAIPKYLDNSSSDLAKLFGSHFAPLMYVVIVLGILGVNVLNLYGAFMSTTTTLAAFTKLRATPKVRFWLVFATAVVGTALAIWGQGNFMQNYSNLMLLLQYFMIPWTAINLVDFYLLRHGEYSIQDIFDVNGQYGKFNWITIMAYVIAIVVEVPFVNTTMYEGPVAKALGGADIAWVIGLIAASLLYYYPMKNRVQGTQLHSKGGEHIV